MKVINSTKCKQLINSNDNILIDIREKYELDNCSISKARNIAMSDVENHLDLLNSHKHVILMCQSGKRAIALGNYLCTEYKIKNILVLEGGIEAYMNT